MNGTPMDNENIHDIREKLQEVSEQKVKQRDQKHLDPSERAELVNSFIFHALALDSPKDVVQHPLYWDLLCWCLEMLNLYTKNLAMVGQPELMEIMKLASRQFYGLHYSLPENSPELGPEREEHEELWVTRIEEWV